MKSVIPTFGTSIITYALITIPCIFVPPIYFLSLIIAFVLACIALIPYALFFYFIKSFKMSYKLQWFLLIAFIPVCLLAVFMLMSFTEFANEMQTFYAFPALAIVSTWIGLYATRKLINQDFKHYEYDFEFEATLN